jgi:hypothetical protein
MIGAAVQIVRGVFPEWFVDMALNNPIRLKIPMVPAEGLCLLHNGFAKFSNGSVIYQTCNLYLN